MNQLRPKILIYTDFGGGKNRNNELVTDIQTSEELASAAWKSTLQEDLFFNDSAKPLDPYEAALHLAKSFPFKTTHNKKIHTIVVHVIDPGVGNNASKNSQPRSIVLRKDGLLFIGPDNGSLSFVCPKDLIEEIWEIDSLKVQKLSKVDLHAGGTFHGRDLFLEVALRIAAKEATFADLAVPYEKSDLQSKFSYQNFKSDIRRIEKLKFIKINTKRAYYNFDKNKSLFEVAFLLGVIQSPLYSIKNDSSKSKSKRIFFINYINENNLIAIINSKTNNVYIGPNNGYGTAFFKDFDKKDIHVKVISKLFLKRLLEEKSNNKAFLMIKNEPIFIEKLQEVEFLGDIHSLTRDEQNRPISLKAKVWIDLYGNIKTTARSELLNEAKNENASLKITLNGITHKAKFADTFSEVEEGELFVYNGSSAGLGPNPRRSSRYVEVASNGIYGKFSVEFFKNKNSIPKSSDLLIFEFDYKN